MNYRLNPYYSVILMSQRNNAPYSDRVLNDGITIEYEGHDEPRSKDIDDPKIIDKPQYTKTGALTQNGLFIQAVEQYKRGNRSPEKVKVYEKILSGVWSFKGFFNLIDYRLHNDGKRNSFVFVLQLSEAQDTQNKNTHINLEHTRLIPSEVKREVWRRDGGKCVLCQSSNNLHFDHDLPFSKGGTSLTSKNIRLLCMKCNFKKSDKIE
ncbi:MAG: HNH endonuclease [Candidatus Absconditabacterales bacterium]|nr:HNH endonuclease [Candidatus Absconditabacterales bacterium]